MKSLIMYIALPVIFMTACLYFIVFGEDVYRYPCQDPANWETEECQPPQCEAMGLCTKYLIDLTGIEDSQPEQVTQSEEPALQFNTEAICISENPCE